MGGLCDKCGKEYFVSCHDCLHRLAMVYHSCKKLLVLLTSEYEEERAELLALKRFYEEKILATTKEEQNGMAQ